MNQQEAGMRSKAIGSLIGLVVLLVPYVGAYLALVEPETPYLSTSGSGSGPPLYGNVDLDGRLPRAASYRHGDDIAACVFRPLQYLDVRLRPRFWQSEGSPI